MARFVTPRELSAKLKIADRGVKERTRQLFIDAPVIQSLDHHYISDEPLQFRCVWYWLQ